MTTKRKLQQALTAIEGGRFDEAEPVLNEVLERQGDNLQAHWLLIQLLERTQRSPQALQQLAALLSHVGENLMAINQAAAYLFSHSWPLKPALKAYASYISKRPGETNALFNYAWYLAKDGRFEMAIEHYRRALTQGIDAPEEAHLNIANIYMDHLRDPGSAQQHLEQALAINPDYFGAHYNLGNLAEQRGDRDTAAMHFEHCLTLEPGNQTALARLGDIHRFETRDDPLLGRLETAAGASANSDLHFALGRAYDQLSEFELAWLHFSAANKLDREKRQAYRAERVEALVDRIISRCDHEWLSRCSGESHAPVFICGMFRTGSTLLEQALGAHPAFCVGGESEFFPRLVAREFPSYPEGLDALDARQLNTWREQHLMLSRTLSGDNRRLTDKRPDNFLNIGLIRAIVPAAKFIVTERDWRDVATSIFATRLGPGQAYATRLQDIGHYIGQQRKLVDHWQTLLGPDLVRVRYEDLVTQPRRVLESLLEALGESWDERCLSFASPDGAVRTASVWQVREPIHSRSIGRWRNYRQFFAEAFDANPEA